MIVSAVNVDNPVFVGDHTDLAPHLPLWAAPDALTPIQAAVVVHVEPELVEQQQGVTTVRLRKYSCNDTDLSVFWDFEG